MCPEFNQINEKLKVDNINFKNYPGCRNIGGLGVKATRKERKLGAKFA